MRYALPLLGLIVGACSLGPRVKRYAPATTPHGAIARLNLDHDIEGELLALDDTALIVLNGSELWLVRYRHIQGITLTPGGLVSLGRRPPAGREREWLRLHSRFPQGLSEIMRERLLRANAQPTLSVYNP